MAFKPNSSSTAVSWDEVVSWSSQLADQIDASKDKDVKAIFPVEAIDIIPAYLIAKKLGINILPGHADLPAFYLAFHVDNSKFCDISFVNYKLESNHQLLTIPKHFVMDEIYDEEQPKKTFHYPWYNI